MTHSISGSGDVTKLGTGILTHALKRKATETCKRDLG